MNISTRLSITFSVISNTIFIVFGITIYLLASNHRKNDFNRRLKERVIITEKMFLQKDSFNSSEFEKIKAQFLHTLNQETEEIVEISDSSPEFKYNYPSLIHTEFLNNDTYSFEYLDKQGLSKIFRIDGRDYLIIVTALDQSGIQYLSFLKYAILSLILIGIPIIFVGSYFVTKRALLPISKKINHADTISATNLHLRLKVYNPNDEIGKLAIAFNRLLDRLEKSFEAQKSFISNASHEIKNPLTAIMGEAEIAISKPRTLDEYLEALKIILSESETLNLTVNNLLQLSKVDNEGRIRFKKIRFDKFLHEIKESFDFVNPNNQVIIDLSSDLDRETLNILGNKNLMKTAVLNLLDNACKFSANGIVDVKLTRENNWLELTINDSGIGIADKDIDKIKDPFFRGNNALKIRGSGIGLALSSKIISLHDGSLEIQSHLEIGTNVHIKLPLISS